MKIALVTGGQPRFTPEFPILLKQLKGFGSADLYFTFWRTDWAEDSETARRKIEKILPPNYQIAKIQIVDQPVHETPPCPIPLDPPQHNNVQWWYQRTASQLLSLTMSYALIDKEYDAVVRFRVDGMLDREIDISQFDLAKDEIIFPSFPRSGEGPFATDQFAIGQHETMKYYFSVGSQFKTLIPEADPTWWEFKTYPNQVGLHKGPWGCEPLLDLVLRKNNIKVKFCDFGHKFNTFGRSRFTDKHYHHGVTVDPTA